MSCSYDLRCTDCSENCGFDLNHGAERLLEMWKGREALAALAGVDLGDALDHSGSMFGLLCSFAAKHKDHRVVAFNEYGREWDQCPKTLSCPYCNHPLQCTLKENHEPPCKTK